MKNSSIKYLESKVTMKATFKEIKEAFVKAREMHRNEIEEAVKFGIESEANVRDDLNIYSSINTPVSYYKLAFELNKVCGECGREVKYNELYEKTECLNCYCDLIVCSFCKKNRLWSLNIKI